MSTLRALAVVAIAAALVAGCEREARRFEQPRAGANLTERLRLSEIKPGGNSPRPAIPNGYEENAPAIAEGQRLFRWYNCNGCHANGGGDKGPALMDDVWIYGSEPANVFATIMEGRPNGMPSFAGRIPEEQAWKLAAYVRSMSGLVRGDAAPGRRDSLAAKIPENRMDPQPPHDAAVPPASQQTR